TRFRYSLEEGGRPLAWSLTLRRDSRRRTCTGSQERGANVPYCRAQRFEAIELFLVQLRLRQVAIGRRRRSVAHPAGGDLLAPKSEHGRVECGTRASWVCLARSDRASVASGVHSDNECGSRMVPPGEPARRNVHPSVPATCRPRCVEG